MSTPTAGERAFASEVGLPAAQVAEARRVLNAIALLPWPEPERVSLVARLARAAKADVGVVYGRLALRATPLAGFDALIPIIGIGMKRTAGLVRGLGTVDLATLTPEGAGILALQDRLQRLQAENAALASELDRWRRVGDPGAPGSGPDSIMRVSELVSSVASQAAVVAEALRSGSGRLRLAGVALHVEGAAATVGTDLALDLSGRQGGSAVSLSFAPGGEEGAALERTVPDVVGYTPALARRKLAAAGLEARISTVAGGEGVVAEQEPAPGTLLMDGGIVRILVR
jgi:hypothetical protein